MKDNYKPQMKYDAVNTTKITFKFNNKTDADILEYLDSLDNKQGTIKNLIRQEIERNKGE